VENSKEYPYHELDETTPWYEFLQYCEICHQLNVPGQPSVGRYNAYRRYLKSVGIF
jgi:cytochrome c5